MKVAIIGIRSYEHTALVKQYVFSLPLGEVLITDGDNKGTSQMVQGYAHEAKLEHQTPWPKGRRVAGVLQRSAAIAKACDRMVVFWDGQSPGCLSAMRAALNLGKDVLVKPVKVRK